MNPLTLQDVITRSGWQVALLFLVLFLFVFIAGWVVGAVSEAHRTPPRVLPDEGTPYLHPGGAMRDYKPRKEVP